MHLMCQMCHFCDENLTIGLQNDAIKFGEFKFDDKAWMIFSGLISHWKKTILFMTKMAFLVLFTIKILQNHLLF